VRACGAAQQGVVCLTGLVEPGYRGLEDGDPLARGGEAVGEGRRDDGLADSRSRAGDEDASQGA
jgi:hypothetical protein